MSKQYRSKEALGNGNNQVIGEWIFPEGSSRGCNKGSKERR
jgi:hypothetical protein